MSSTKVNASRIQSIEMQIDLHHLGYPDVTRDERLVEVAVRQGSSSSRDRVRVIWDGWQWTRVGGKRRERVFEPEWLDDVFEHVDDRVGDLW